MRRYVIALAMILASSQAYSIEDIHVDVPLKSEEFAVGRLVPILEKFKQMMKTGNEKIGMPVLDPLQVKHLDLNLKKEGLIELEGTLDNLRATGLSNYDVEKGELTIIGLLANVSLSWEEINLMTSYKVTKGKLADTVVFYGDGSIAAVVRGLQVLVDMKVGIKDGKLFAKEVVLHTHLKKLDFEITGLFDDVDMSKLMSKVISELVPQMIEDYQSVLTKELSPIVAQMLNQILNKLSLKDILG